MAQLKCLEVTVCPLLCCHPVVGSAPKGPKCFRGGEKGSLTPSPASLTPQVCASKTNQVPKKQKPKAASASQPCWAGSPVNCPPPPSLKYPRLLPNSLPNKAQREATYFSGHKKPLAREGAVCQDQATRPFPSPRNAAHRGRQMFRQDFINCSISAVMNPN